MSLTWQPLGTHYALYADGVYTGYIVVASSSRHDDDDYAWLVMETEGVYGRATVATSRTWPTYTSAQTWVEAFYKDNYGH